MDKNIVKIDLSKVILAKDKAGQIVFTKDAEEELQNLMYAKRTVDAIYDFVQDKISDEMEKQNILKIVTSHFSIVRRVFGKKYALDGEANDEFKKEISYFTVNSDTVNQYFAEHGELPQGIIMKGREEKIVIKENL